MAGRWRFTALARSDLHGIADYSESMWGSAKAEEYIHSMTVLFQLLADRKRIGRPVPNVRLPVRRIEHQSQVVFYKTTGDGIVIQRVLHKRQLVRDVDR